MGSGSTNILYHRQVNSPEVAQMQCRLKRLLPDCTIKADGDFWIDTKEALIRVQRMAIREGYLPKGADDGVFGPQTAAALSKLEDALLRGKNDPKRDRHTPLRTHDSEPEFEPQAGGPLKVECRPLKDFKGTDTYAILAGEPSDFAAPITGKVRSDFGPRARPAIWRGGRIVGYGSGYHMGIDIPAAVGTPVYATADGVVEYAAKRGGYGNTVILDHKGGIDSLYAHLSKDVVHVGEKVKRGQLIGYSGNTGNSAGPHLHYETRKESGAAFQPTFYGREAERGDWLGEPMVQTTTVKLRLPKMEVADAGPNGAPEKPPAPTPGGGGVLNTLIGWLKG